MKVLDLFSGIGGFSLGLERAGMETVAFCEFEPHAQKILKKHWPDVPCYDDVRTLDGTQFRGSVDVVCGGFPCQDLSVAGKKAGFDGERSSLYREMLRIIGECGPRYAIFENVTGLLSGESGRWFAKFLYDLAEIGFDAEWHCISASELGAHHHRDRVWIVAYPNNDGQAATEIRKGAEERSRRYSEGQESAVKSEGCRTPSINGDVADSERLRQQRQRKLIKPERSTAQEDRQASMLGAISLGRVWSVEPELGRVANGIPDRMDRLTRLGNTVIPQIPEAIGRAILAYELQK